MGKISQYLYFRDALCRQMTHEPGAKLDHQRDSIEFAARNAHHATNDYSACIDVGGVA